MDIKKERALRMAEKLGGLDADGLAVIALMCCSILETSKDKLADRHLAIINAKSLRSMRARGLTPQEAAILVVHGDAHLAQDELENGVFK